MLIHGLGNVGHVKVGVLFVGELLELGVEGFLEGLVDDTVKRSDSNIPEQS